MYQKDFDDWNILKQKLHQKTSQAPLFHEREIWWVSIGVNVGFEEDGKHNQFTRPVLVIKKFNRYLFLGIPMSTKLKDNPYYLPVTVEQRLVSVLLSQIRVYSSQRMLYRLGKLEKKDYNQVVIQAKKLLFLPLSSKEERVVTKRQL